MPAVYNRHRAGVPEDAVGIERGTEWGNPFRVGRDGTRRQVIERFRAYVEQDVAFVARIRSELGGRDLVCCCKPKECHGDVLLQIANN